MPSVQPPSQVLAYTALLVQRLRALSEVQVVAVYLHGSASLGGWRADVSDVDLLVVVERHMGSIPTALLTDAAVSTTSDCPGTGLELSAVAWADAASPRPPWPFVAHVAGNRRGRATVVLGDGHPGDPDLLLHYAVCRAASWAVGPPADQIIGCVPRPAVLQALATELVWGLEHAPAAYALLNACRALVYQRDAQFVAKTTGARWVLDRGIGPSEGIRRALAAQTSDEPVADLTDADISFIEGTARGLAADAES